MEIKYAIAAIATLASLVLVGVGIIIAHPQPIIILDNPGVIDVSSKGTGLLAVTGLALIIASRGMRK